MKRRHRAFSLIELLVVITIIAVVISLMLPALSGTMRAARETRCLASMQQMGVAFTAYFNDNRDHFPEMPVTPGLPAASNQFVYGGVAGLFSLNQRGNGAQQGFTGGQYVNGATVPVLSGYLTSLGALRCPSDRTDRYYGYPYGPSGNMNYAAAQVMRPEAPGSAEDVVSYNVSYMYMPPGAGRAAVLWLDETDGPDINEYAWYGPRSSTSGTSSVNSLAAGASAIGFYAPGDNHGVRGANMLIRDGHAYFQSGLFNYAIVID